MSKMLNSYDIVNEELREFYNNFDNIFLRIYPTFVAEFNKLLRDNETIELKSGERLNTELRIFALIRMGITDSVKIADYLHYSVSTIYNYRTKMRNRSVVPRNEFEIYVCKIGV